MNPYEANPDKIPPTDRYVDEPLYGRYFPCATDFVPDAKHINCTTPESLEYWSTVLKQCTESSRIYENQDGGRDVFALGSVIVKSSHLKEIPKGRRAHRDYSYADANEVEAIAFARKVLDNVQVPRVYFAAKINGRDVFIQERVPGVGLNIAWQYISQSQKDSFKQQAREMLLKLHATAPPILERDIIFAEDNKDLDLGFMHNDVSLSNLIVDNGKVVGLVDWEMAGFFGWKTAASVHVRIRTPKRENFASLNLDEDLLNDILFWNDLYEVA